MSLPAEQGVIKALKIAGAAKRNHWHGHIDAPLVDGIRQTTITATRNDESIKVLYHDDAYQEGQYKIFDRASNLHCASVALEKVQDWPDLIKLFKDFPSLNRPTLVGKYRKLPFEHDDPAEDVMSSMYGRSVFWYSHEFNRMDVDVVLAPRTSNSKQYRIAPVGHRRIFHFVGQKSGFRSVLLDTIIKVG